MKKKKGLYLFALLIVLVAAAALAYRAYANSKSSTTSDVQTTTVQRGSLTSNLSSSGNVRSGQTATVSWQTTGKVGEISLAVGDQVQEDQVLAALDPETLSTEMISARLALIDAQQAMDDLLNSKTQQAQALQAVVDAQKALDALNQSAVENRSQAQLALTKAQASFDDAKYNRAKMDYPHTTNPLTIEKAETDYMLAKNAYKEAQKAYAAVDQTKLTNPERVNALSRLVSAEQAMNSKLAIYNWYLLGYSEEDKAQADAELAVAQANLEAAQANWEDLKDGVSDSALALAQAKLADAQREWERVKNGPSETDIAAAQAKIDTAQVALDHAQLLAPFDGTITESYVTSGDLINSGDKAFRIDDMASLHIELQISEIDLATLKVGQPATLAFDAIADKEYAGVVESIGLIGTVSQGVVNYPVTVRLTNADADIRQGMTASVTIILQQVDNVLMVPNRAIRNVGGQRTVTVLYEGQQITLPVEVGLVGDSMSEVISDQLREGDAVVVTGATNTAANAQNFQFRGPGGGGFIIEGGGPIP